MRQAYLILIFALIINAAGCKDEKTEQDYVVRVGNQAFGVYLNGQPWIADYRDAGNGVEPIYVRMVNGGIIPHVDDYNYIWAKALKSNEEVSLYIPPPLKPGRVLLNKATYPYPQELRPPAYGMYRIFSPEKGYMTTTSVIGYVDIISADTIQRTIEARFEFEAINTATNEKVKITNGYFKK
jgi:hypothetical protein